MAPDSPEEEVDVSSQLPKLTELPDSALLGGSVVSLNASVNELSSLPLTISTCLQLRVLDVSDNKLTALPPELGQCALLEELLLYKNQIKALPIELANLSQLRVLNAFNNKLTKLDGALGKGWPALEEINVAANKLMMLPDVPGWSSIRVLSAYDNRLVKVGSFAPCTTLVELRLYNNNLEALPELPPSGAALELLELHNNRIGKLDDDCFAGCAATLKRLLLAGNQLTALPSSLSACAALQFLQVGSNQLTTLPPAAAWSALETLFLEQNPIASLPSELLQCAALTRVNLSGTALPESGDDIVGGLMKQALAMPGGSFWGVNGRRFMSDEVRAASFVQSKQKPASSGSATSVLGAIGGAAKGDKAPGWSLIEEEENFLVCDGCGKELSGLDEVWLAAADACDYCKSCSVTNLEGGGEWTTAQERIASAEAGEVVQQPAEAAAQTPEASAAAEDTAAAAEAVQTPTPVAALGDAEAATPQTELLVGSPPLLPDDGESAAPAASPKKVPGNRRASFTMVFPPPSSAPAPPPAPELAHEEPAPEEPAPEPEPAVGSGDGVLAPTPRGVEAGGGKGGPLSLNSSLKWLSQSSCCGLRKPADDGSSGDGSNAFDTSIISSLLIKYTSLLDAQLEKAIGAGRASPGARAYASGPITPFSRAARPPAATPPPSSAAAPAATVTASPTSDWKEAD